MALAVVQQSQAIHTVQIPGAITLGSAPTSGNLLIALLGVNQITADFTPGTGWIPFELAHNGSALSAVMFGLYRYVQPGDTATLPAFFSAGNTYWTHNVWEVSGVSGSWDADFLTSFMLWNSDTLLAQPTWPVFTDCLALSAVARYNGTSNWTIGGSWTLDGTSNNNGNYGSSGGAHRSMTNGDSLDGTWADSSGSTPVGSITLILTEQRPSVAGKIYPRHVFTAGDSGSFPGAPTVPWIPKQGSLLIAYINWGSAGIGSSPTNAGNWTQYKDIVDGGGKQVGIGLYYYTQVTDTTQALPAIMSAGTDFYILTIVELDGVRGSFGADHISSNSGEQASGTSLTTTSDATTANDQFAMLSYGNYDGVGKSSTTGFDGYLQQDADNANYGSSFVAFKFCGASGTTVQGVTTPDTTVHSQEYIQDIFGTAASSQSANIDESMSLSDTVNFAASGSRTMDESMTLADDLDATIIGVSGGGNVTVIIMG